jgi:hypothetical protein
MKVILWRYVAIGQVQGGFTRTIEVPFIVPGMGIVANPGCDPVAVEQVFYNSRLELVAELERCVYTAEDLEGDDPSRMLRFHTEGWNNIGDKLPY